METMVPPEDEWWWHKPVTTLSLKTPITVHEDTTCSKAIEVLEKEQIDQMPILSKQGWVWSHWLASRGGCGYASWPAGVRMVTLVSLGTCIVLRNSHAVFPLFVHPLFLGVISHRIY